MKKYRLPRKEKKRRSKLITPWNGSRIKKRRILEKMVERATVTFKDRYNRLIVGTPGIPILPHAGDLALMFNNPEGYKVFDNSWEQDPDKVKELGIFIPACDSVITKQILTSQEIYDRYGKITVEVNETNVHNYPGEAEPETSQEEEKSS
jgi:hypothetical protein